MWQPNAQIIQIEYGRAIGQASAVPGKKGFFGIGATPDNIGGQLVEITDQLQAEVLEKEGLQVPGVLWQFNPQLKATEVIIRIGLETHSGEVHNFGEIFGIIVERCRFFGERAPDRKTIRGLLDESLGQIGRDDYQGAFELQTAVYYGCARQGLEHEMSRCLSDSGLIFAKNADIERAKLALYRAWELCSSPNMMDIALKSQIAYNAAQIALIERDLQKAFELFFESGTAAKNLGFSHGTFMALTGIGQVAALAESWDLALSVLEQAESVILEGDSPDYQAAYQVTKSIIGIKDTLIRKASQKPQAVSQFDNLKKQIFSALVRSAVQAVVYRLFGVTGGLIFAVFGKQEDIRVGDGSIYVEKPRGDITFR